MSKIKYTTLEKLERRRKMYSYVSLKTECPHCGKSLMEKKKLVDEIPSIKLIIKSDKAEGVINFSAFYGSHNYLTDIDIEKDKAYHFSCPHCKTEISSENTCDVCSAPLIPLNIKGGGVIRFCSRAACKKHSVIFEDLSSVHNYFQETYDENIIHVPQTPKEAKAHKELIKSGTFLRIYCPHCQKSNIEKGSAIFWIINEQNEAGYLMLSPYLNVFTSKYTVFIPEGAVIKDVQCPQCKTSLLLKEIKCGDCEAPAVGVSLAALRKFIDFYFCSKKGCHWHSLSEKDLHYVSLEDSDYW